MLVHVHVLFVKMFYFNMCNYIQLFVIKVFSTIAYLNLLLMPNLNPNGVQLLDFFVSHSLSITNTISIHKIVHKCIW